MPNLPPEVMQALQGRGKAPGGPPPTGPAASPMMTPQKPSGQMEQGRIKALVAQKQLEQALAILESGSKEGAAVLKAINALAKAFGKSEGDTQDLLPSERKTLADGLPGGPPGGLPGGAPPGGGPPGMPPPGGPPGGGAPGMPPMAA